MTTPDTTTPAGELPPLRNGTRRDKRGHFITGPAPEYRITPETARTLATRRQEQKREIIAQAANAAVQRGDLRLQYGDNAWIAAIAANMQDKATTLDDPKSVDAARFLLQETGIAESRQAEQQQAGGLGDLLGNIPPGGLVMLIGHLRDGFDNCTYPNQPEQSSTEQSSDVLDVDSTDAPDTPTP